MEEIILLFTLIFVAYIFRSNLLSISLVSKLTGNIFSPHSAALANIVVPEDSTLRRHFLTQLSTENALVAAELQKRLSL